MKTGKLSADVLKRNILDRIKVRRPEVLVHSAIGEDCSIIDLGGECCVMSSDPITGASGNIGTLAVNVSCNDIAASGASPFGIMVTILAPTEAKEEDIFSLMDEINAAAGSIGVEVLGGHTEVTPAVNRMVVSLTAVGKAPKGGYVSSSGARCGDSIIVTKHAGLEGTAILASEYGYYLEPKMGRDALERCRGYMDMISVIEEGAAGVRLGATSMHDATEGGLLGAVWEVAEASGCGFEIYRESIPITSETEQVCSILGIDPLRLISSGMMVITAPDAGRIVGGLKGAGIDAACIGRVVKDSGRRVMISAGVEEYVDPPENDELFNVKLD